MNEDLNSEEKVSEAAPGISPEEVAAIGLYLLAQRRESVGVYGSIRYQPLADSKSAVKASDINSHRSGISDLGDVDTSSAIQKHAVQIKFEPRSESVRKGLK